MSDYHASGTALAGSREFHPIISFEDTRSKLKGRPLSQTTSGHTQTLLSESSGAPESEHNQPFLTEADRILIANLHHDPRSEDPLRNHEDVNKLLQLNAADSSAFQQPIITSSDEPEKIIPGVIVTYLLRPYVAWAHSILRRREDVVFVTHMLLHVVTVVPSALYLYQRFTYLHGILHFLMIGYYCGPFSILHHNHIHSNGFMLPKYALFDNGYLYLIGPLMGHTWNSFYYHHVKHHHIENNGPQDLSSTIMFQRDELVDFLQYFVRFLFFIWLDLPLYFIRTRRPLYAFKYAFWEVSCAATMLFFTYVNFRASFFVFLLPFFVMRLGLMAGNWAQHAFVDEDDPESDFRSSITLIDVASNRHCFNDGYHTTHHLNSLRHWRDHPSSFLREKHRYIKEGALVFQNIGYLEVTFYLLCKDYARLARCLVPLGDQINMTQTQIETFLRSKTRRFSDHEIETKFRFRSAAGASG